MKLFWKIFSCRPRPKPQRRGPLGPPRKKCKKPRVLSRKWRRFFFRFFLSCFFCCFKAFLSLGGPFSYICVFSRPRPKPQSRGPLCFCAVFCQKHLFFYMFFLGGPLFCFLFFCFCSFKSFLSLGGPFSYTFKSFLSLGGPFSYTFKAFLSLGGPFSSIYVFFFLPRPKPQRRGPLCFYANFCQKHWFFCIFFLGGPLFCFLFFCFCSFKAFLSLGGPFSYISDFFRPRPEPKDASLSCFCTIFCQKQCFFTFFPRGPLVLVLVLLFLLF